MSKFATLAFCALTVLAVAYARSDSVGVAPISGDGQVPVAVRKFCRDAGEAYLGAARRVKLPKGDKEKIGNKADGDRFWKEASAKADEDAYGALGDRITKATGEKWDEDKVAAELNKIGQEFLDASK